MIRRSLVFAVVSADDGRIVVAADRAAHRRRFHPGQADLIQIHGRFAYVATARS
jgi:hypothetical protein